MKCRKFCKTIFILSLSIFAQVEAAELYEFYNGVRQMGMGGATIATVNDETALFANPAALGKLRDSFTTIADPEIDYGEVNSEIATGAGILEAFSLQGVVDKLNTAKDKHFHLRTQVSPSLVLANFGIGVYEKYSVDGEVKTSPNDLELDYRNDLAFVIGYCLRIWDGRIKFGFNAKYISRLEINNSSHTILPNVTGMTAQSHGSEGAGISADVGLMLAAPWALLPTLAIVAHDVGNTEFNAGTGLVYGTSSTRPRMVPATYDAALAIFPVIGNRTRTTITLEARDVTNVLTESDGSLILDPYKKYHGGIEINISDMFFIRAGMHQHYWTAGLEFAYDRFQFQIASYGEDIGIGLSNREDRRYSAKFAYRF
jgi:hypothetical protein